MVGSEDDKGLVGREPGCQAFERTAGPVIDEPHLAGVGLAFATGGTGVFRARNVAPVQLVGAVRFGEVNPQEAPFSGTRSALVAGVELDRRGHDVGGLAFRHAPNAVALVGELLVVVVETPMVAGEVRTQGPVGDEGGGREAVLAQDTGQGRQVLTHGDAVATCTVRWRIVRGEQRRDGGPGLADRGQHVVEDDALCGELADLRCALRFVVGSEGVGA